FIFSAVSGILSFLLLFGFVPDLYKDYLKIFGYISIGLLIITYLVILYWANNLTDIEVDIDGSNVNVKCGDLFAQQGLKVIPFNEYFDTLVDDKIISNTSLNGIYINKYFANNLQEIDDFIKNNSDQLDIIDNQVTRKYGGKSVKFKLSTIFVYDEFIITAFSKFDENNRANLTMPEYIEFLINFWDRVNRVYAQRTVSVPVFGSGITRIKEHKNISDEELLKIMLWTFKLSEMKFKYPAKLTIIIHKEKIKQINLFDIKSIELGI
ncbi:macro domain-containing protein, partial [uncultured Chryseobacterium sp.]|uniref:macro domain-containing protein n=1 Tax=uncultured Chryseobacterium sp. TaxID=259322 RepID=UPI0025907966